MSDPPRRRSSDFGPDDHDLLISLDTSIHSFMREIREQFNDFRAGRVEHRAETATRFGRLETRVEALEVWKNRIDGAAFAGNKAMALAFSSGVLVCAVVTLLLKLAGRI